MPTLNRGQGDGVTRRYCGLMGAYRWCVRAKLDVRNAGIGPEIRGFYVGQHCRPNVQDIGQGPARGRRKFERPNQEMHNTGRSHMQEIKELPGPE